MPVTLTLNTLRPEGSYWISGADYILVKLLKRLSLVIKEPRTLNYRYAVRFLRHYVTVH